MGSTGTAQVVGDANTLVTTFEQIGSRWRVVVLYRLGEGEMRFNELKRSIGANARTLSRVLADLQDLGLVERRVEEDAPVATFYRLSEKGAALTPVFRAVQEWGDDWIGDDR